MEYNTKSDYESKPLSHLVFELGGSIKNLVGSELNLMREETKANTATLSEQLTKVGVYGSMIALGSLALLSFMIIGLGNFLNHQYWLSSLIIAVAFLAIGGIKFSSSLRSVNWRLWTLPHSQESMRRNINSMSGKISEIREAFKRSAV